MGNTTKASNKRRIFSLFVLVPITLAGCANYSTLNRTTALPDSGLAIHLDAPQRVVLTDKNGFSCAEPSPDALQAYASAIGASLADPTTKAAAFSAAANTSAGNIGLRTQSITLMRETLFRLCESARNKSITSPDLVQLLQRSQDMTLAILAIEQLTGAVVARQVLLGGSSNASASANVANTQAALDSAKKNEQIAKDDLAAAQSEEKRQTDILGKISGDLTAAEKKVPPDQTASDELKSQQKVQGANVEKVKDGVTLAQSTYTSAQKATQVIQSNFNAALASAQSSATGTGEFSTATGQNNVDKESVAHIAEATKDIINMVVNKGHITDTCFTLMSQYAIEKDPDLRIALKELVTQCTGVISTYLEVYKLRYSTVGTSPPLPAEPPPLLMIR